MALNWDATKVKSWEEFTEDEREKCARFAFELMAVGVNTVTEEDLPNIYARVVLYHRMLGEKSNYTWMEIRKYVGFRTNVSSETDKEFLKRVGKIRLQDLEDAYKKEEVMI